MTVCGLALHLGGELAARPDPSTREPFGLLGAVPIDRPSAPGRTVCGTASVTNAITPLAIGLAVPHQSARPFTAHGVSFFSSVVAGKISVRAVTRHDRPPFALTNGRPSISGEYRPDVVTRGQMTTTIIPSFAPSRASITVRYPEPIHASAFWL
jgi:hypothetical protein